MGGSTLFSLFRGVANDMTLLHKKYKCDLNVRSEGIIILYAELTGPLRTLKSIDFSSKCVFV